MSNDWLTDYFERIHFEGSVELSLDTLRALHTAHVFHVPFENLDIHMGRQIQLDSESLINKIVYQRRGGYCFEMNGLFSLVLETMGFKVDRLLARIWRDYVTPRPRTHQVSLIHIDGQAWLADVGYGAHCLHTPLLLKPDYSERQFTEHFRIMKDDSPEFLLQGEIQDEWKNFYSFPLEPYRPLDYVPVNYYTSTSPDSHFTQRRAIAMSTPNGRITMVNETVKVVANGIETETVATTLDEYVEMLERYFGIVLSAQQITFPA
ncbi:MAG: arylamine N-acetyltransferase [Chloroflexota bacterium]